MIKIKGLKLRDIGGYVKYTSSGGDKIELGRIKSWNNHFIFVSYYARVDKSGECLTYNKDIEDRFKDYTGQATSPQDLVWIEARPDRKRLLEPCY